MNDNPTEQRQETEGQGWHITTAGLARNRLRVEHPTKGSFVCNSEESALYARLLLNALEQDKKGLKAQLEERTRERDEAQRTAQRQVYDLIAVHEARVRAETRLAAALAALQRIKMIAAQVADSDASLRIFDVADEALASNQEERTT